MASVAFSFRSGRRLASVYSAFVGETWSTSHAVLGAVVCSTMRLPKRFMSKPLEGRTVRIGCASGFWGDSVMAGKRLRMLKW